MTVRPNQIASDDTGGDVEILRSARIGCGKVSIVENSVEDKRETPIDIEKAESRIAKVLPGEVGASKIIELEADPAQVMGLVAGRGVELCERNSVRLITDTTVADEADAKVRSSHLRASKIGIYQCGTPE